jgi:peptidyl-tRNA hydrolase
MDLKYTFLISGNMSAIVQYVVVRGDLVSSLQWPLGALVAQACHAATAVLHVHYGDETTQKYFADLDNMHKIVLEIKDEAALRQLAAKLTENSVAHKMWIEQPENYPTCLAVKPYEKGEVQKYFKKFKLYKGPPLATKTEEVTTAQK